MKHRSAILIIFALAILTTFIWLNKSKQPSSVKSPIAEEAKISTKQEMAQSKPALMPTNSEIVFQSPAHNASEAEKWAWWREMGKKDIYFEYKMPISFYGRVVDESNQSVSGANVAFSWTDLSPEGTSQKNTVSDAKGFFSMTGATGKTLTVQVHKEGYKNLYSNNRNGFEYAMFAHKNYYQPDAGNPVVFVLRKNREAEELLEYSEKRAEVGQNESKQFTIGPNGVTLLFERMTNDAPISGGWIARVSVPGGGLALTTEEFPYEAPEDGYMDSIEITSATPKPPNWPSDSGAMLYFKTSQGYGRVVVRYISSMNRMFVTSWYNPNSNSRNLEIDPTKIIRP